MDVNIYLGLGIVFLLAAVFGGIEALGFNIPRPKRRIARIGLAVAGVALVAAAYFAPLPGTTATKVADYRKKVQGTCAELKRIRDAGDDALKINEKMEIDTVHMIGLFRRQLAQQDAALEALWGESAPRPVRGDRKDAVDMSEEVLALAADVITHLEQTLPAWATQAEIDQASTYRQDEVITLGARTNRSMSDLAGKDCGFGA